MLDPFFNEQQALTMICEQVLHRAVCQPNQINVFCDYSFLELK